jgi:hypothetical protein
MIDIIRSAGLADDDIESVIPLTVMSAEFDAKQDEIEIYPNLNVDLKHFQGLKYRELAVYDRRLAVQPVEDLFLSDAGNEHIIRTEWLPGKKEPQSLNFFVSTSSYTKEVNAMMRSEI